MTPDGLVRGPLLIARADETLEYVADGALAWRRGAFEFVGPFEKLAPRLAPGTPVRAADGVMLPPLLDAHTHVSQHPIRGRFAEGVDADAPGGTLLASLERNVFPAELRCADPAYAEHVARDFLADTLQHGVVGGMAYMTSSAAATEAALRVLPDAWAVGLVLMDQNCPEVLRTDAANLERDVERLFDQFGRRLVITDRFAVAVSSPLRRQAAALAKRLGLRTQTHLNEQVEEKRHVEQDLYPDAESYADVYARDGLLGVPCVVAHCVHMRAGEWATLRQHGARVAHCPTSNLLLGSGTAPLAELETTSWALGTDVGASPTVSMLAEAGRFVRVHEGRATAARGLWCATRGAARVCGLDERFAGVNAGAPASFIEVAPRGPLPADAEGVARALLPADLDDPAPSVRRVTLDGRVVYAAAHA